MVFSDLVICRFHRSDCLSNDQSILSVLMRKFFFIFLFSFMLLFVTTESFSQCAMCRRVAETGESKPAGKRGLNAGILYLLSIPYVLGGVGVYMWHRNRNK